MLKLNFTSLSLLVSKSFLQLLSKHCEAQLGSEATSRRLTLRFRDKSYSVESGGCHPVDIGLTITDKANVTIIYITDFAYIEYGRKALLIMFERGYMTTLTLLFNIPV